MASSYAAMARLFCFALLLALTACGGGNVEGDDLSEDHYTCVPQECADPR